MPQNDYYIDIGNDQNQVTLPSEQIRRRRVIRNNPPPRSKKLKWGIIIGLIILIYMFYNSIILFFLEILCIFLFDIIELTASCLLDLFGNKLKKHMISSMYLSA